MPTPAELADVYLKGAADLRDAVAGMTRDQLIARPIAGRWSTLEVVCHIADFEPILAERMKRILAAQGDPPLLLAADENEFLAALHYHDRDLDEELAVIEGTRKQMARLLRGLTADQLQFTGIHSKRGRVTLESVLQMATIHIPHHLPYVAEKKAALGIGSR